MGVVWGGGSVGVVCVVECGRMAVEVACMGGRVEMG